MDPNLQLIFFETIRETYADGFERIKGRKPSRSQLEALSVPYLLVAADLVLRQRSGMQTQDQEHRQAAVDETVGAGTPAQAFEAIVRVLVAEMTTSPEKGNDTMLSAFSQWGMEWLEAERAVRPDPTKQTTPIGVMAMMEAVERMVAARHPATTRAGCTPVIAVVVLFGAAAAVAFS